MAAEQLSVGIFGATGTLGRSIVAAFLEPQVRQQFRHLVAFSRIDSKLEPWRTLNHIKLSTYSTENIDKAIVDLDLIINAVNTSDPHFHASLIKAMAKHKHIKVYVPSEFGIDRSILDFHHESFERSKNLSQLARSSLPQTKICQIYPGFFLETILSPWLGIVDTNDRFISVGPQTTPVSCTATKDIGRSVAQLCLLSPSRIPDIVHLAGTTNSIAQMADIMGKYSGDAIQVVELSLSDYKASVLVSSPENPAEYLRFIIGEGKANHGPKGGLWNDNELVNPGQRRWKWSTMEDLGRETRGRPWVKEK